MKALVTCISGSGRSRKYRLIAAEGRKPVIMESATNELFKAGEAVELSGNGLSAVSDDGRTAKSILDAIGPESDSLLRTEPYSMGIRDIDEATERMWPKLLHASKLLLRKLLLSAPIIIRFHNDCDGSSGACSIYKAIESLYQEMGRISAPFWIMHKSISYRQEDAESDTLILNGFSSYEKPLIMILDFGTSEESNSGIAALKDSSDIIWLDHHPLAENAKCQGLEHYVNPWQFSSDSNYTAGTLASVFAASFSSADVKEFVYSSMIGDYSDYRLDYEKAQGTATILDMLTSDPSIIGASEKISPKELIGAVEGERRKELLTFANVTLMEVMDSAVKEAKRYEAQNGIAIYVLDYEKVKPESRYPLPGRFSSKLLEELGKKEQNGVIVLVHAGMYISIRSGVSSRKLSIRKSLERVSGSKQGLIDSYGGHEYASSVKVRDRDSKAEVIAALVNEIKRQSS